MGKGSLCKLSRAFHIDDFRTNTLHHCRPRSRNANQHRHDRYLLPQLLVPEPYRRRIPARTTSTYQSVITIKPEETNQHDSPKSLTRMPSQA